MQAFFQPVYADTQALSREGLMRKHLPPRPSLPSLRNQAKQLRAALQSGDVEATDRVVASFPRLASASHDQVLAAGLSLRDLQFVVAREYGFPSWPTLVGHIEGTDGGPAAMTGAPIANPFITGKPVRGGMPFFGREDCLAYMAHQTRMQARIVCLTGGRRVGKTSLLLQIFDGRLGSDVEPFFLDMQTHAQPAALKAELDQLLTEIGSVCEGRPLLLIDEAEILRDMVADDRLDDSVLVAVTTAVRDQGLSLILSGSARLPWSDNSAWLDLLRDADQLELRSLSFADTRRLLQEPFGPAVFWDEDALAAAHRCTGGHPWFAQVLGAIVADSREAASPSRVTVADVSDAVDTIIANPPPQLPYGVWPVDEAARPLLPILAAHDAVAPAELQNLSAAVGHAITLDAVETFLERGLEGSILERHDDGTYGFLVDIYRRCVGAS